MSKQPRESLVQYLPPLENIITESKVEEKKKNNNLDSRLAIDCNHPIIQNYSILCFPLFNGIHKANNSLKISAQILHHVKTLIPYKNYLMKN